MHKMKKLYMSSALGCAAVLASTGTVFAALSTEQQAVATALDTMISDLAAWGWTAILAILSFTVGAKLLKKFFGKAT